MLRYLPTSLAVMLFTAFSIASAFAQQAPAPAAPTTAEPDSMLMYFTVGIAALLIVAGLFGWFMRPTNNPRNPRAVDRILTPKPDKR